MFLSRLSSFRLTGASAITPAHTNETRFLFMRVSSEEIPWTTNCAEDTPPRAGPQDALISPSCTKYIPERRALIPRKPPQKLAQLFPAFEYLSRRMEFLPIRPEFVRSERRVRRASGTHRGIAPVSPHVTRPARTFRARRRIP